MHDLKRNLSIAIIVLSVGLAGGCGSAVSVNKASNSATSNMNNDPAAIPVAAGAEVKIGSPEALVADLYKQHDAQKGPFGQKKNRGLVDKYFTKTLADLIWKDANQPDGEIGAIDADPLYNAQDVQIKSLVVGKADIKDDRATVPVTFQNYDLGVKVDFALELVDNAWKIADIKYTEASLLQSLKEAYGSGKTNAPPVKNVRGEFEGTYRIGSVSCTVTPVKMAFEVRWAKGKGAEMYFVQTDNTFESEAGKDGGTNRFVFDDENYNSGTFYRADGTTMVITRSN